MRPVRAGAFAASGAFAAAVAVNLATIRSFPSWLDEAFFANMAFNLSLGRGLLMDLTPGSYESPLLLYGPVFFQLQAWVMQLAGPDAFVFRLLPLLCGYGAIALLARHLRSQGLQAAAVRLFVLAAVLDVSFNRSLVSGRMDMTALLFVAASLVAAGDARLASKPGRRAMAVGLLAAAAYLTTPRALFLLPATAFSWAAAWRAASPEARRYAWLTPLAFSIPVAAWIAHAGGLSAYAAQFAGDTTAGSHIAPSLFRSAYDNVGIAILLVLAALRWRHAMRSAALAGLLATFIAFSLFVKEQGPYAGMVMPFVIAGIALLLHGWGYPRIPSVLVVAALVLPGAALLALRAGDLVLNTACRDGERVRGFIAQAVPAGARVIAPFKYYFLLEEPGREVVSLEYIRIDPAATIARADAVVAAPGQAAGFEGAGFTRTAAWTCTPRRLPFLPDTFYARSTFDEVLLARRRP